MSAYPTLSPPLPQLSRNLFSLVSLSWLNPLLRRGSKKPLNQEDLPELADDDKSAAHQNSLNAFWSQLSFHWINQESQTPPAFGRAAFRHVAHLYLAHLTLLCVKVAVDISLPLMTDQILRAMQGDTKTLIIQNIYGLSMLFFGIQLLSTIASYTAQSVNLIMTIHLNSIIINAIYAKSLRLSTQARKKFTPGYINTLISNDVEGITTIGNNVNLCITSIIQIGLALYYLWMLFGFSVWISLGVYFLLFVVQFMAIPQMYGGIKRYQALMDMRIKRIREFFYGIKIVKFQAAEEYLAHSILNARSSQLAALRSLIYPVLAICFILILQQYGTQRIVFIVRGALDADFSPNRVFSGISLISVLVSSSGTIGSVFSSLAQFIVSYRRVNDMLVSEEVRLDEATDRLPHMGTRDSYGSIRLSSASFIWELPKETQNDQDSLKGMVKRWTALSRKQSSFSIIQKQDADFFTSFDSSEVLNIHSVDPAATMVDRDEENFDLNFSATKHRTRHSNTIRFELDNLSLNIAGGKFVAVVGTAGSGKSSLLEALVGGMRKTAGSADVCGSVAYCTQEPWILSGTIEDNILFGNTDITTRSRMSTVLDAVCLANDLVMMPSGLNTQIGENGIMLSASQRSRVALARALARDADIVLLDDPLAALGAQVSHRVLDKAICGMLKGKTIILATHQLQVLPKTDLVVVMDGGKIVESGPFKDLMSKPDSMLTNMMNNYTMETPNDIDITDSAKPFPKSDMGGKQDQKSVSFLLDDDETQPLLENRQVGVIKFQTVKKYFASASMLSAVGCLVLIALNLATNTIVSVALASWTGDLWGWKSMQRYLRFYIGFSMLDLLIRLIHTVLLFVISYHAARKFHDGALFGLLSAPMSFFESQPVGYILNRMTMDIQIIDRRIFVFLCAFINNFVALVSAMFCTIYVTPLMVIIVFLITVISIFVFRYFRSTYRELRRLIGVMTTPLIAHVSESLNGITTIKAYQVETIFIKQQQTKLDLSNKVIFLSRSAQIWLGLRIQLLSLLVTLMIVLMAAVGMLSPAIAGLGLYASMQIGCAINATLYTYGNLEAEFNSVERLNHFAHGLPREADRRIKTDPDRSSWPNEGSISIRNLEIRYPNRPNRRAISVTSLNILPGEKVGVIGNIGSGKSTLVSALFRIVEASSGYITIDGINIATLGLRTLRSRLQIIPQNPVLFDGTIRSNIDLNNNHSDDEVLWNALEIVGLKDYVSSLSGRLDAHVAEGGSNLSAGQRQLLCLCRAILARPKILVMDEAAASVDADADRRIQAAVTSEFRNTTVLSIAHRLNTIAAYDKVVVLDAGKLVECDAPHVLLEKPGSMFSKLVEATGSTNSAIIRDIAAIHHAETKKKQ